MAACDDVFLYMYIFSGGSKQSWDPRSAELLLFRFCWQNLDGSTLGCFAWATQRAGQVLKDNECKITSWVWVNNVQIWPFGGHVTWSGPWLAAASVCSWKMYNGRDENQSCVFGWVCWRKQVGTQATFTYGSLVDLNRFAQSFSKQAGWRHVVWCSSLAGQHEPSHVLDSPRPDCCSKTRRIHWVYHRMLIVSHFKHLLPRCCILRNLWRRRNTWVALLGFYFLPNSLSALATGGSWAEFFNGIETDFSWNMQTTYPKSEVG